MLRKWFRTYRFILAASAVFVWWLLRQPRSEENEEIIEIVVPKDASEAPPPPDAHEKKELKPTPSRMVEIPTANPAQPDDLTRIEGIGPKISSILQQAGITTYAALSASSTEQLRHVMQSVGLRLARPDTWCEQAGLAASGQWKELENLQQQIKGGRKVGG